MLHTIFVLVAVSDTHIVLTFSFGEVVVAVPVRDDGPGLIAVVEGEVFRISVVGGGDTEHGMWQRIAGGGTCIAHHRVIAAVAAFVDCDIGGRNGNDAWLYNNSRGCVRIQQSFGVLAQIIVFQFAVQKFRGKRNSHGIAGLTKYICPSIIWRCCEQATRLLIQGAGLTRLRKINRGGDVGACLELQSLRLYIIFQLENQIVQRHGLAQRIPCSRVDFRNPLRRYCNGHAAILIRIRLYTAGRKCDRVIAIFVRII